MSDHVEKEITPFNDSNSTNTTTTNGEDTHCCQVVDALYKLITFEKCNAKLQKVLLSSSYPSPISLKLQGIQEILKDGKGCMDINSLNFAIQKLMREETIDRSPTNSQSLVSKYYISGDFVRFASTYEEDGLSDLETCVHNNFVYYHNAFGQYPKPELLCIPVDHHGSWSLYAFNMSDQKLSILDPAAECVGRVLTGKPETEHEKSRLKICKALGLVKQKFNLFKNTSGDFSSWRYEFIELSQFGKRGEDSGFLVFYFMQFWDGHQLVNPDKIPKEPKELRKRFLEYIVSFQYNEVYELDDLPFVFGLMEKLKLRAQNASGTAWTRCKMDTELLKVLRENNVDAFDELFESDEMMLQNLRRGATCDGDGVLHIAARYGKMELLNAILNAVDAELSLDAIKSRRRSRNVREHVSVTIEMEDRRRRLVELDEFAKLLRSRNHKGETCLHEAVRQDNAQVTLSLILADEEIMRKGVNEPNNYPPLVQRVDYEGVSPLYLATTLCHRDIVRILTDKDNKWMASYCGPGGKTALHAAVLLDKELTVQLVNWTKDVEGIPDLSVIADNYGNTPLHLVSAVGGAPITALLTWNDSKESIASSPSTNTWSCRDLDRLYEVIKSEKNDAELQTDLLSSSYPSPITLKLQVVQELLKDNKGRMDINSLNFAIRKLRREETIDRSPSNSKSLVCKYYISADFAKLAMSNEGQQSHLETCGRNDFAYYHHNVFGEDADLSGHPMSEVLCIPVVYDDRWRLYAFNMSDQKISVFDPTKNISNSSNSGSHKLIVYRIFKALRLVKKKFNLRKPRNLILSRWSFNFTILNQFRNCSDEDSGFLVFYFMRFLDSHQSVDTDKIPKEPKDLRKSFLEYIVTFNYNEVYQFGDLLNVFDLMENLKLRAQKASAWTRCEMDTELHMAVKANNVVNFDKLFEQSGESLLQNLIRGATSDGDGVLHIAAKCGNLELLRAIFKVVHVELSLEAVHVSLTIEEEDRQRRLLMLEEFAKLLRSRNHKGETCLHEAIRKDNAQVALSLILADEEIMRKGVNETNNYPPLVQIVDYEGVSPLYLATTLRHRDIVGVLTHKNNKWMPSYSGPGGMTALHAAVLLDKELTDLILNWMKHVECIPDLRVMEDNSGKTPLDLASKRGATELTLQLLSWMKDGEFIPDCRNAARKPSCAAFEKDSKGWLPIHVAAANGRLDVIKQLIEKCPECLQSRNASGQSFLHIAVEKKSRSVVQYVCSQKSMAVILNLTDHNGNTALHLAVKNGNQRIFCDLMRNKKVLLSSANREGRTPRDVAMLSLEPGLRFLLNSRVLIYYHLKLSGAHSGTCRRDILKDEMAGNLDKDKLSKAISKSAGLMAVCATFMLNMSVTTFFNIAKPNLLPTANAEGRSTRARAHTFNALIAFDTVTFASSLLTVFCSIFAGFSIMDRPIRFFYLRIAGFSLQIACLGLLAVFVSAAYLAFAPVDPRITTVACLLPIAAFTPQLMTPSILVILHVWTLYAALFQKHVLPKTKLFFETHIPAACLATVTFFFTVVKAIMKPIWICCLWCICAPVILISKCFSCCKPALLVLLCFIFPGMLCLLYYYHS